MIFDIIKISNCSQRKIHSKRTIPECHLKRVLYKPNVMCMSAVVNVSERFEVVHD